jgi:hypothetical protein
MFWFLKKLFGGDERDALVLSPAWSFSDAEPISEAYRPPQRVDYELDLSTWRYRLKGTFCNDDPNAESEISYARMEYEVRRSPAERWEVRLVGRNGLMLDTPEAWEAAPARFLNAWEQAWADRRQMTDDPT